MAAAIYILANSIQGFSEVLTQSLSSNSLYLREKHRASRNKVATVALTICVLETQKKNK